MRTKIKNTYCDKPICNDADEKKHVKNAGSVLKHCFAHYVYGVIVVGLCRLIAQKLVAIR